MAKADLFSLLLRLMPGFLAAWVFYGLTSHQRKEPFERVVQALIFTGLVQVLAVMTHWAALWLGDKVHSFGPWTDNSTFVVSVGFGFVVGFVFAVLTNRDLPHEWLRGRGLTTRSALPSEWYSAFHKERRWVVLSRKDGRRIYGDPVEWPEQNEKGHFVVSKPSWVDLATGERTPIPSVYRMVIPAADVEWVEVESLPSEHGLDDDALRRAGDRIKVLHQENGDGKEPT